MPSLYSPCLASFDLRSLQKANLAHITHMLTETLSIKVSKTEKNSLRKVALERKSTPSRLLRVALQSVLSGNTSAQASLLERHQHLFASLDHGPGDLSTNPEHLRNFGK